MNTSEENMLRHGELESVRDHLEVFNLETINLQLALQNAVEQIIILKRELEDAQCRIVALEGVVQP